MLEGLDLTLRLSKAEEEARVAAAQRRLLHLRLVLGGLRGAHARIEEGMRRHGLEPPPVGRY